MSHVMYADDILFNDSKSCILTEINLLCYDFSVPTDQSINSSKSYCMVFKSNSYKLTCLILLWII